MLDTLWTYEPSPSACGRCKKQPKFSTKDPGKTHMGCKCNRIAQVASCQVVGTSSNTIMIGSHLVLLCVLTPGGEKVVTITKTKSSSTHIGANGQIGGIGIAGGSQDSDSTTVQESQLLKHTGQDMNSERFFAVYNDYQIFERTHKECQTLGGAIAGAEKVKVDEDIVTYYSEYADILIK